MSSLRLPVALAVLAGLGTFGSIASAQVTVGVDVNAPPPPPPPQAQVIVVGQPGPVYAQPVYGQPGYAQPGYAQPGYAQPVYVQQPGYPSPYQMQDHGRLRFGIEGGGGVMLVGTGVGSASGGAINIDARIGWQINNPFAVYAQFGLLIGVAGGQLNDGTVVGGAAVAETNSVLFEYTWNNLLHFGLGPSADAFLGGLCSSSTSSSACIGGGGWAFGADARFAVILGSVMPGRRRGVTLGVDLHPIFAGGVWFFGTANIGFEMD